MIKVLVADDHPLLRAGLGDLLSETEGLTLVGSAADGEEAVELACSEHPDVVLMDLEMPGVDGIVATQRIRAEQPSTQVVVLTSFADRERILAALDAGAAGYLLKDAEPEELLRGIREAAAGGSPLAARAATEVLAERAGSRQVPDLTPREQEVLDLVADGLPNKLIAQRLAISEKTVKTHLTRVFAQLGVTDRTQAALWMQSRRGA
jgi:DNA-binding NarL/FixJ family response regulator